MQACMSAERENKPRMAAIATCSTAACTARMPEKNGHIKLHFDFRSCRSGGS